MGPNRLHHREIVVGARTVDLLEPDGPFRGDLLDAFMARIFELFSRGRRDIRLGCRWMTELELDGLGR